MTPKRRAAINLSWVFINLMLPQVYVLPAVKIKELPTPERKMINEVISVCKLILVNPATSESVDRSFSTARRLKTWLRSTMPQERFTNLTILNSHKERTNKHTFSCRLCKRIFRRNHNRKRNFGVFRF